MEWRGRGSHQVPALSGGPGKCGAGARRSQAAGARAIAPPSSVPPEGLVGGAERFQPLVAGGAGPAEARREGGVSPVEPGELSERSTSVSSEARSRRVQSCVSHGRTAIASVGEAISAYIAALEKGGLRVPRKRFDTIVVAV